MAFRYNLNFIFAAIPLFCLLEYNSLKLHKNITKFNQTVQAKARSRDLRKFKLLCNLYSVAIATRPPRENTDLLSAPRIL